MQKQGQVKTITIKDPVEFKKGPVVKKRRAFYCVVPE